MAKQHNVKLAHHHTAVCCEHWETSLAFYEKIGFVLENDWYWPDGVKNHKSLLSYGGKSDCWMELFEYPGSKGILNERYTDSAGCVYQFALEAGSPAAVDAFFRLATGEAGGSCVMEPCDIIVPGMSTVWETRQAVVAAPDGEHIAVVYDRERSLARGGDRDEMIGFHHNALHVADIVRSINFYEAMGFSLRDIFHERNGVEFAIMTLENGNGLLIRADGKTGLPTDVERMRAAGSMFQYCFSVETAQGIDDIYEHCLKVGGRDRIKPFLREAYGMANWVDRPAFCYGPDDEILEFLYINYENGKEDDNG